MKQIFEHTLLYDFYGELLTEHQKAIYEDAYFNDLSYSEIAQERGISRQGVYDLIKRCNKILQDYEDTLHLVERFLSMKQQIARIDALVNHMAETKSMDDIAKVRNLTVQLLDTI